MRTHADFQKSNSYLASTDVIETSGDECLIFDARSQIKPTEVVERKLQHALQVPKVRSSRLSPFSQS